MFREVFDEQGNLCGMERYYAAGEVREEPVEITPDYSLLCDGRAVSRAEYAELFAVIGTAYGDGDGKRRSMCRTGGAWRNATVSRRA